MLTKPGHDLLRCSQLYQGVTVHDSFALTVAERLDRLLADLLALEAHLRGEPLAQPELGVFEIVLSLSEPAPCFSVGFLQLGILCAPHV